MVVNNILAHGRKSTLEYLLRFLHEDGFVIVLGTLCFQHQHTDRFLRFRNNFYNILLLVRIVSAAVFCIKLEQIRERNVARFFHLTLVSLDYIVDKLLT